MIAVFDTSTLIYLLRPDTPAPLRKGTQVRVDQCQARIEHLLADLQRSKATIVIPTPTLSELLVMSGEAGPDWLRILTTTRYFRPAPFDVLAAVECSIMAKDRMSAGRPASVSRAKAKFDEQIVAIARIERASIIYSDDEDIRALVGDSISVRGIEDLPLPPAEAQGRLDFQPPALSDDETVEAEEE